MKTIHEHLKNIEVLVEGKWVNAGMLQCRIPPAKDEPASRNWQDVYKWMQDNGVGFEVEDNDYCWFVLECEFNSSQNKYRIDLGQTPPDNWREIYKTAQEFGVEFLWNGTKQECTFKFGFKEYQLSAAKREEPKPKTVMVELLREDAEHYANYTAGACRVGEACRKALEDETK